MLFAIIASTIIAASPTPDFTGDGVVDVSDVLYLLNQWGECGEQCPGDLTSDGTVDVSDLLLLLANWGPLHTSPDPLQVGGMLLATAGNDGELAQDDGIVIRRANLPAWLGEETFCIAMWARTSTIAFRSAFAIEGLCYIRMSGASTLLRMVSDEPAFISADAGSGHSVDEWRLILASWNPSTGTARCYAVSETSPSGQSGTMTAPDFAAGPFNNLRIGTRLVAPYHGSATGFVAGMPGHIGPIVIRRGVEATLEDAVAMYNTRQLAAPLFYNGNDFFAVHENEEANDMLVFNHGLCSSPSSVGVAAATGAYIGKPVAKGNYLWLNKNVGTSASISNQLMQARPLESIVGDLVYADHREAEADFFQPDSPGQTTDGVVGDCHVCALLGDNEAPESVTKIAVWSNSRGMRRLGGFYAPDGDKHWYSLPGSHANGFIASLLDRDVQLATGIIGAYLHDSGSGGSSTRRQFIFDAVGGPFTSGTVSRLGTGWNDFRRFWTGSGSSSKGPGDAIRMAANAVYSFKAKHMPETPATKDVPLRIKISYLRYPGGRNFAWEHVTAASQNASGTAEGPSGHVNDCDTSQASHNMAAADHYSPVGRTLTLTDGPVDVAAGWAVYVSAGNGAGSIAEIESVDGSTLTLRHPFETAPSEGSTLHFGPWSFGSAEYTAPATTAEYRGPRITAAAEGTGPTILLSYSAWVDGAHGFAFAPFGWGGNGFAPQLEQGMKDLPGKIAQHLELDAVFLHGAFQSSSTASMAEFAASVQSGSDAQAVLLSDQVHHITDSDVSSYAEYILQQSDFAGSVATEAAGSFIHQIAHGRKMDRPHPNIYGQAWLAKQHMALWATQFEPDPAADRAERRRAFADGSE